MKRNKRKKMNSLFEVKLMSPIISFEEFEEIPVVWFDCAPLLEGGDDGISLDDVKKVVGKLSTEEALDIKSEDDDFENEEGKVLAYLSDQGKTILVYSRYEELFKRKYPHFTFCSRHENISDFLMKLKASSSHVILNGSGAVSYFSKVLLPKRLSLYRFYGLISPFFPIEWGNFSWRSGDAAFDVFCNSFVKDSYLILSFEFDDAYCSIPTADRLFGDSLVADSFVKIILEEPIGASLGKAVFHNSVIVMDVSPIDFSHVNFENCLLILNSRKVSLSDVSYLSEVSIRGNNKIYVFESFYRVSGLFDLSNETIIKVMSAIKTNKDSVLDIIRTIYPRLENNIALFEK